MPKRRGHENSIFAVFTLCQSLNSQHRRMLDKRGGGGASNLFPKIDKEAVQIVSGGQKFPKVA